MTSPRNTKQMKNLKYNNLRDDSYLFIISNMAPYYGNDLENTVTFLHT